MAEINPEVNEENVPTGNTVVETETTKKTDRGLLDTAVLTGAKLLEGAFVGLPTGTTKALEKKVFPSEITSDLSPTIKETFAPPLPVVGASFPVKRERDLKSVLLAGSNVKVEEALNFENEKVKNNFMSAVSSANSQGEILVYPKVNAQGQPLTFEQKLAMANRHGAVDLAYKIPTDDGRFINQTVSIPYEKLIAKEIAIPANLKDVLPSIPLKIPFTNIGIPPNDLQKRAGFDSYNIIFSTNDPKVMRTSFAYGLNHRLIELGVDSAKDRLGILRYYFEKPDFRELEKGKDVIFEGTGRFFMSSVGWFAGEMLDLMDGDLSNNGFDWRSSEFRTGWYDTVVPRHATKLQDRLKLRGIELDYATAEYLSRYFHSKEVYLTALAGEIAGPSKFATAYKKLKGQGMLDAFNKYAKDQLAKNSKLSEDDLISGFLAVRERDMVGPLTLLNPVRLGAEYLEGTRVGQFFARINRSIIGNNLSRGFQLDDAVKNVDAREEVIQSINYKNNLVDELNGLKQRIVNSGKPPNSKQLDRISQLEDEIISVTNNHTFIVAESAVPKFIRDVGKQDAYLTIGAAAVGSLFTEVTTTDPALGEAFGLAGGLIASLFANNKRGALEYLAQVQYGGTKLFRTDEKGSKFGQLIGKTGSKKGLIRQVEKLATDLATTSPEFADGIVKRIQYFEKLQSGLIKAGVDPAVVERGLDQVLGLGVLQMVDHQVRTAISTKNISKMDIKVEELAEVRALQNQLVAELRGALQSLDKVEGINIDGSITNKFQKLLTEAIDTGQKRIEDIDSDIAAVSRNNAAMIKDRIEGNSRGAVSHLTDSDHYDMEDVVDRLNSAGIETIDEVAESQIIQVANDTKKTLSESFRTAANKVKSVLSTTQGARLKLDKVMPDNLVAAGAKGSEQALTPEFDNFKHLMEGLWETLHATAKTKASAPFIALSKASYKTADGVFVGANPTVDGGLILDQIFTTMETLGETKISLLKDMSLSQINPTKRKNLFAVFENAADDFFTAVAASDPETYPLGAFEVVESLQKKLIDEGYSFQKGKNAPPLKVQVITHLRDSARKRNSDPDSIQIGGKNLLEFDFNTLKEFNSTLKRLSYKEKNSEISRQYDAIADQVEKIMRGDFSVEEGATGLAVTGPDGAKTSISKLFVEVDGNLIPAADAIQSANDGWFKYKSIWFDSNNKNSQWMDWANRSPKFVSGSDPLGVVRKNKGNTWIDFDKLAAMDEIDSTDFYQSIKEAFGGELIEGSEDTEAFISIIEVGLSDWLVKKVTNKDVDINEVQDQLQKISRTFTGVNDQGQVVQLLNPQKINDVLKYSPNSVPANIIAKNDEKVKLAIKNQTAKVERSALKVKRGLENATKVLQRYMPTNIAEADIAENLVAGGDNLIKEIKVSLKELDPTYSEQEIDEIIRTMYIDAIDRKVFRDTGNVEINTFDPNNLSQVLDLDINVLGEMLGINDPAKQRLVKKIIDGGDSESKRYQFYQDMFNFMSEESSKIDKGVELTGVPRRFTPEAWISRFYALKRHVISPPYVGTEALLQTMRLNNFSVLRAILSDPEIGSMFIQMMKTGKALSPKAEDQFFNALVVGLAKYQTINGKPEVVTIQDKTGRKFEVYVNPRDRIKFYGNLDQYSEFSLSQEEELKKQKAISIPKFEPVFNLGNQSQQDLLSDIQTFTQSQSNIR